MLDTESLPILSDLGGRSIFLSLKIELCMKPAYLHLHDLAAGSSTFRLNSLCKQLRKSQVNSLTHRAKKMKQGSKGLNIDSIPKQDERLGPDCSPGPVVIRGVCVSGRGVPRSQPVILDSLLARPLTMQKRTIECGIERLGAPTIGFIQRLGLQGSFVLLDRAIVNRAW